MLSLPDEIQAEEELLTGLEDARILAILRSHDEAIQRVLAGLTLALDADAATQAIIELIETELGDAFPAAARPELAALAEEAWRTGGAYRVRGNDGRRIVPAEVVEHFTTKMQLDLGNTYRGAANEVRFRTAIESVLAGKDRRKVLDELQSSLLGALKDPEDMRKIDWMLRQESNRARNYSRIRRLSELKINEMEVLAVLDSRTSAICRLMHGRRVVVSDARSFVDEWLDTAPADLRESYKQPPGAVVRDWDGQRTGAIVKGMPLKVPPYHPGGCRSTIVAAERVILKTQSDHKLKGRPQAPRSMQRTGRMGQRLQDVEQLTPDELLAKITALRNAQWEPETLSRTATAQREIFGLDETDFAARARDTLREFDRIFITPGPDNSRRYGFYHAKRDALVTVDYDTLQITGMFRPASKEFKYLIEVE